MEAEEEKRRKLRWIYAKHMSVRSVAPPKGIIHFDTV